MMVPNPAAIITHRLRAAQVKAPATNPMRPHGRAMYGAYILPADEKLLQ
jgi:hypothetical protein